MNEKKYVKEVGRHLHCSKEKRREIERQLTGDIGAALECGETLEEILERMGTAKNVAEEFNANFTEEDKKDEKTKKSTARLIFDIVIMICVAAMVIAACINGGNALKKHFQKKDNIKQEASGGQKKEESKNSGDASQKAGQPQVEELKENDADFSRENVQNETKRLIECFCNEEYEQMFDSGSGNFKKAFGGSYNESVWKSAKEQIHTDCGAFVSYGNVYMSKIEQDGRAYVMVQMNAAYENVSVTYTITLDEEMKLDGFYVK